MKNQKLRELEEEMHNFEVQIERYKSHPKLKWVVADYYLQKSSVLKTHVLANDIRFGTKAYRMLQISFFTRRSTIELREKILSLISLQNKGGDLSPEIRVVREDRSKIAPPRPETLLARFTQAAAVFMLLVTFLSFQNCTRQSDKPVQVEESSTTSSTTTTTLAPETQPPN